MTRLQFAMHVVGLSSFRWFRRWVGGRWERWLVSTTASAIWHHNPEYTSLGRPPCCFGTPDVEDYGLPRARLA